jgi:hypothetical protein
MLLKEAHTTLHQEVEEYGLHEGESKQEVSFCKGRDQEIPV